MSYPGHPLGRSYPSAEVQSVYSTAPIDWATWCLLSVALHYQGEAQYFFYWRLQGVFFEDFHAHVAAGESVSVLSVWLQFKNSKDVTVRWSHYKHSRTYLAWRSTFGVSCGDCPLSNHCLLPMSIVIKEPFFVPCNNILEKRVISLLWEKICWYGYIFIFLFIKRMRI